MLPIEPSTAEITVSEVSTSSDADSMFENEERRVPVFEEPEEGPRLLRNGRVLIWGKPDEPLYLSVHVTFNLDQQNRANGVGPPVAGASPYIITAKRFSTQCSLGREMFGREDCCPENLNCKNG